MTLKEWFNAALEHGTVYYVLDNAPRDGMGMHAYQLATIVMREGRPCLERAWPMSDTTHNYDTALAKTLGHRLSKRAWCRSGCGYDRVHDILYSIAREFGYDAKTIGKIRIESLRGN